MFPAHARVRPFVLIIAAVLTGGLLLLLHEPGATSYAARSPLPTITPVCLPLLGGGLSLSDAGYVLNGDDSATFGLGLQNQDAVDLTRISFSAAGWTPLAPAHDTVMAGLLGDHLISWYAPGGRLDFTPLFGGYSLGASERFSFTVQGFIPAQAIQLTVRKGEDVLETHTIDLSHPACDHTPPVSPLPPPTPALTETFPAREVFILSAEELATPLSEEAKQARWQQGLPVPLASIEDETLLPREFHSWPDGEEEPPQIMGATQPASSTTTVVIVDGWVQEDIESFEGTDPTPGGCGWTRGHTTTKAGYEWGKSGRRARTGSHAAWPAGIVAPGSQPAPADGAYPDNLETWLRCGITPTRVIDNISVEFQLWLELDNPGDRFEVRFYNSNCAAANPATTFRGGYTWEGTANGVPNPNNEWRRYQIFYPGLRNPNTNETGLCIEFKFTSNATDGNYAAAQGPWLDDAEVWDYVKPASSVACQDKDPTLHLANAPGSGNVSKGIVLPPYADDFKDGTVDNPANLLDIAGMVQRLLAADVQWARLEFIVPPGDLLRSSIRLGSTVGSRVDLRHFDRVVDMLCANNIAMLGLLDNQTIERQDWTTNFENYLSEFVAVTKQMTGYFSDRIRYWEVWNEPNFTLSAIDPDRYAELLVATHDAIKAIDGGDKVLFAGLAQAASNSDNYFRNVSAALGNRRNPAPYDIFALHPYPSDEYKVNGRVVTDPSVYLHWSETPSHPTTIFKFFETMVQNGKANQPIWITEVGWNRAAESTNEATLTCPAITVTMVSGPHQALYAVRSFDILFSETAWDSGAPSVTKIFWYQYMDVGQPQSICTLASGADVSPSGLTSYVVLGAALGQSQADVDWWYGLYSGIDWEQGGRITENPVQCTFRNYPMETPGELLECLGIVYLPTIHGAIPTASE